MIPARKRFNAIDIAKVAAIILVVVGHYFPEGSPEWWVAAHDAVYTFHMPLFFFASGFLFAATERPAGYGAFMKRKFLRLMVPYFSASVVIISFKLLTERGGDGGALDNPVTAGAFLEMFWMPSAGYFLWFIWALMWMFAAAGLFRGRGPRVALAVIAVALAYGPLEFTRLFCLEQAREMFVYFMLGAVGADLRERYRHKAVAEAWLCAAVAALFAAGEAVYVGIPAYGPAVKPVLPYLGIGASLLISRQIDRRWRPLRSAMLWLAPYTYFIYLFHTTFEGVAKAALRHAAFLSAPGGVMFALTASLVVACGIAGPVLAWRWVVGRVPFLSVAFGAPRR